MSSISKVIVVQDDRRAADAVRLGFEREGIAVVASDGDGAAGLVDPETSLVVAGAAGSGPARALLASLAPACRTADAPILWLGNGVGRAEAWAAGADEVLPEPAFVRDVVTVGRLLAGRKRGQRNVVVSGDLADTFGVFYLVRAIAATGRSGVLTLVRGLRRGELRFFEGELTSAHMGGLHGQAGFHQLLLWTEARFEWRHEPVVRRRQIPLAHEEVLAHAERFLGDIRDVAGGLSPACVYEQDVPRIGAMAKRLPTEVHGVLRLFDGNRTVADVLEDSPFRVFETLRVAQRAVEVGLLRRVETQKPKAARRAVLAVEEWLVGESRDAVIERTMQIPDTAPGERVPVTQIIGDSPGGKKRHKERRAKGQGKHEVGISPPTEVDWTPLLPRATNVDMSAITGVVPSASASGEIEIVDGELAGGALAARREGREGLEALTDPEQRAELFPAEPVPVPVPVPVPDPEPMPETVPTADAEPETAAAPAAPAPSDEPAFLRADLAAVHEAAAAVVPAESRRPPTAPPITPDPATVAAIEHVREDAVAAHAHAFSEDEEAFFQEGHTLAEKKPHPESFSDLDEGYRPPTFWDRFRGKTKRP